MRAESGPAEKKRLFSWKDTPKLGAMDVVAMLWAERLTVLAVGAVVMALALAAAFMAPRTYEARAELLVRLGQEYVFQPSIGGAGAGAAPDMEAVVNAELRLLASPEVARRAIAAVGATTLYPDLAGAPQERREALAVRALAQNFSAVTAPRTPAISLGFKHKSPEIAARTLNALIDSYLSYRREVLVGGESDALARQAGDFDTRVAAANTALSKFLTDNEIGDFDSELAATAKNAADVETALLEAQARRREAEGRAAAMRARYNSEPAEIELYSESDARRALVQLQMDREQLLGRYQPDAPPVREIDRRISQLNAFLGDGSPAGLTRRGVNPVRQEAAGQLFGFEAEARAQRARESQLAEQRTALRERLRKLQQVEPAYRQLERAVAILEDNAKSFATRAEERRAMDQMLGRSTDNISIVERAIAPSQGKSLRMPIAVVGLLLAGLFALAAGLARGLTRRSFPTPQSAARTLDAPVLAVMPATQPPRAANDKKPPARKRAPRRKAGAAT